jgi:hypothetical protein
MWAHKFGLENPDISAEEYSLNIFILLISAWGIISK